MPICEGLGDILFHNGLIKSLIFLLIPLDKKGAGLPQQDMHNSHVKKILSSRYMRQLNTIAKEHITHDEKVNVRPVGGNDDKWPVLLLVVISQFLEGVRVHDYLLVDCFEHFVQEPREHADCTHVVLAEHLDANFVRGFVQFLLGFLVRYRIVL
jgi:hypothetical protein